MIEYRCYVPGDERQIVEAWNEVLPSDPISALRFRDLVLLDGNFDPAGLRLAFSGGELAGCFYGVRRLMPLSGNDLEPEKGWIPFFFVKEEFQRRGVGQKLLGQVQDFLRKRGCQQVFFSSYAPNYILPGIDPQTYPKGWQFLQKVGFAKLYSPVAMDMDLVGYVMPEKVRQLKRQRQGEGYSFRTAEDRYLVELIDFATSKFNPDWGRAIREGLLRGLPTRQVFVALADDRVVGFCLHGGYEGIPERFGPFGVDESQRGKGLGKILLHTCLEAMRSQGLHGAWFLWTGETSPAGHLYAQSGFAVSRRFHVCRKELGH